MLPSNVIDLFQSIALLVLAGVLVYLWLAVNRLQRTLRRLREQADAPPVPLPVSRAAAVAKIPEPEAIDEGVLAAIAAAVAVVVRQPHRIVAIQPDAVAQRAWSAEGRRELYHSHRIR